MEIICNVAILETLASLTDVSLRTLLTPQIQRMQDLTTLHFEIYVLSIILAILQTTISCTSPPVKQTAGQAHPLNCSNGFKTFRLPWRLCLLQLGKRAFFIIIFLFLHPKSEGSLLLFFCQSET
jgi:hypothetical protein